MTVLRIGLLFGLIAALGTGCATISNPTAQSFGDSFRWAKTSQTLNPEASANLQPAEGFNGVAARLAMERYHESFRDVPTQQEFVLRAVDVAQ